MASIAQTKPACPVAMNVYLTDGVRLVLTMRWMSASDEVMVEDVLTGRTDYLSSADVKNWRGVTPAKKGDDG